MPIDPLSVRRRSVLGGAVLLGAAAAGTGFAAACAPRSTGGRFTLGVASGDPWPDGVVLWTRLAPDPLARDGSGGMPADPVPVAWQVATDERFGSIVAQGVTTARAEEAHSVHVEVSGLQPSTVYHYRFRCQGELSPAGRTKTAPAADATPDRLSFAFASCQHHAAGFYNAHAHLAREDLDLVVFLGDYIYEGDEQLGLGRGHIPPRAIRSLADYRVRYGQYKSDPDLQACHAAFPWVAVFDDHEVENNWAADFADSADDEPTAFPQRRAAAFQAYYEHLPLRRAQRPSGEDMLIHRRLTFGDLADFHLLDTRQFRSDQVPERSRADPGRTMLGAAQKEWLFDNLAGSAARWNIVAQQVFFSQLTRVSGAHNDDAWDNYQAERDEVAARLAGTRNPVVITGDAHAHFVTDIKPDFDDPASPVVGSEFVGTSISSEGDGSEHAPGDSAQLRLNPHLKFIDRRRGYVHVLLTRQEFRADLKVVDKVTEHGSPIRVCAGFSVRAGERGVRRV